tara:strand:- start:1626 stop:2552 length:927 start_codon:yes stop_codon:yes gene_type:complete
MSRYEVFRPMTTKFQNTSFHVHKGLHATDVPRGIKLCSIEPLTIRAHGMGGYDLSQVLPHHMLPFVHRLAKANMDAIGVKGFNELTTDSRSTHRVAALQVDPQGSILDILGVCSFKIIDMTSFVYVELGAICVGGSSKHRGIGSTLMRSIKASAQEYLKACGFTHAYFVVKATPTSFGFYEKFMFYGKRVILKRPSGAEGPTLQHLKQAWPLLSHEMKHCDQFLYEYPDVDYFGVSVIFAPSHSAIREVLLENRQLRKPALVKAVAARGAHKQGFRAGDPWRTIAIATGFVAKALVFVVVFRYIHNKI